MTQATDLIEDLLPAQDEPAPEACCELDPDIRDGAIDAPDEDDGLESVRPWRIAEALKALKETVNAAAPRRSKMSDGSIGDAAHASRSSDHNPWVIDAGLGIVSAIDVTHDPAGGCDSYRLADVLRKSRDPRIKYIISNGRIASATPQGAAPAWTWRAYTGTNPHNRRADLSALRRPDRLEPRPRALSLGGV